MTTTGESVIRFAAYIAYRHESAIVSSKGLRSNQKLTVDAVRNSRRAAAYWERSLARHAEQAREADQKSRGKAWHERQFTRD
jgi:hypothetical protein